MPKPKPKSKAAPKAKPTPTPFQQALARLRGQHRTYVLEYIDCLNQAEAARRAGYATGSARQSANRLMTNADIGHAIELGLENRAMGKNEVLARIDEIAKGTMEDFLTLEEIEYREMIKVPAFKQLNDLRATIALAHERIEADKLSPDEIAAWHRVIDETTCLIEKLPSNPLELVEIEGPVRKTVQARVDLVKAEAAGKLHLVKKVKQTDRGVEVELYAADDAQALITRIRGMLVDRVALTDPTGSKEFGSGSSLSADQKLATAEALMQRLRDAAAGPAQP